jgi:peroxiredoxin
MSSSAIRDTPRVNIFATARSKRQDAERTSDDWYSRDMIAPPNTASGASKPVPAGTHAPNFTLHSTPDQTVSLEEFRGNPLIIAFYPADWSPVCGDQMALYNELRGEFARFGAQLVGISVDGVWCHRAFADDRHLHFPLLADFEPKGGVARQYGVYRQAEGTSERALFVVDGEGVVRWSYVSPVGVNPGADGILTALESLGEAATQSRGEGAA